MGKAAYTHTFDHPHLLGINGLSRPDLDLILELADTYADATRAGKRPEPSLTGKTVVNLFFENSTRTMSSFEIAAKRLGADVVNMPVAASSVKKGETLIDTAMTLNAMKPNALVIRHSASGGVNLLSRKVDCPVINAGDGTLRCICSARTYILLLRPPCSQRQRTNGAQHPQRQTSTLP